MISKNKFRRIIEESIQKVLNESLSRSIYHFTSIFALLNILNKNEMFCQSAKVGSGADDLSSKYDFYISFTRSKSSQEGFGYTSTRSTIARIEFDGDKLSNNFSGKPVNYWGSGELTNKFSYMRRAATEKHFEYKEITDKNIINNVNFVKLPSFTYLTYAQENSPQYVTKDGKYYVKVQEISPDIKHHRENEIEDRLFTNKPIIYDIYQYIKRIDIFIDQNSWDNEKVMAALMQLSMKGPKIFMYDNLKDFDKQSNNTVNDKFTELFDKYGSFMPRMRENINIGFLTNICDAFTFFDPKDIANKQTALLLKKYGFEKYTRQVIKKQNNYYGLDDLINRLSNDSHNVSKDPTSEGQIMLKMLNDFLRSNRYSSLRDAYVKMTEKSQKIRKGGDYDFDAIDTEKNITFKYIMINNYGPKFIINNDNDTDFWFIFKMNDKVEKYNFIENLVWDLSHDVYGETYKSVIRGDLTTFTKYLQSLAHKKVTLNEMFNILNRIGVNVNDAMSENGTSFEIGELKSDYWNTTSYYLSPPFRCTSNEQNEYIKNMFKK